MKHRRLKMVELFLREKEIRLERIKEEIGWLGFGGGTHLLCLVDLVLGIFCCPKLILLRRTSDRNPLPTRTTNLSPSLNSLSRSIETLLSTPSPASTTHSHSHNRLKTSENEDSDREELGVWNHSRTSFVNWVAGKQSSTIGGVPPSNSASTGGTVKEEGDEIGSKGDAKVIVLSFASSLHFSIVSLQVTD